MKFEDSSEFQSKSYKSSDESDNQVKKENLENSVLEDEELPDFSNSIMKTFKCPLGPMRERE